MYWKVSTVGLFQYQHNIYGKPGLPKHIPTCSCTRTCRFKSGLLEGQSSVLRRKQADCFTGRSVWFWPNQPVQDPAGNSTADFKEGYD